jgi:hypothetical protein
MDAKYDKFKKLMSEDKEALPPELGWEHMEAGILKKMEEIQSQADTSTPSKKTDYLRRGFILSILLMLAFCNHNSTNTYPTKTVAVSPQTISNTPSDVFENSIVNTISTSSASSKEKLDNAFSSTENKPLEGISGAGDYSGMTQNLVNPLPKTVSPTKRSENVKIEGSNAKRLDSSNSSDSLPTDFRGEASPILDIGKSQSEEKVQKEGEEGLEKSANQVLNSGPVSEGQIPSTSHWTIAPLSTKEFLLTKPMKFFAYLLLPRRIKTMGRSGRNLKKLPNDGQSLVVSLSGITDLGKISRSALYTNKPASPLMRSLTTCTLSKRIMSYWLAFNIYN